MMILTYYNVKEKLERGNYLAMWQRLKQWLADKIKPINIELAHEAFRDAFK